MKDAPSSNIALAYDLDELKNSPKERKKLGWQLIYARMAAQHRGKGNDTQLETLAARYFPKLRAIVINNKTNKLTVYLRDVEDEFDIGKATSYSSQDQEIIGEFAGSYMQMMMDFQSVNVAFGSIDQYSLF